MFGYSLGTINVGKYKTWTPPVDWVHRNMDPLSWTTYMDPLFLLRLKLAVIKDYECGLCLWYNLNTCLLLKSLPLWTAENLRTKSLLLSESWTLVKSYCIWVPGDFVTCQTHLPVYPWSIIKKHHVTDSNISADE